MLGECTVSTHERAQQKSGFGSPSLGVKYAAGSVHKQQRMQTTQPARARLALRDWRTSHADAMHTNGLAHSAQPEYAHASPARCAPFGCRRRHAITGQALYHLVWDMMAASHCLPGYGNPTSGAGSALPHLHRDCARPPTFASGLGSALPHLRRDWAHHRHICTGTGLSAATSSPGADWARYTKWSRARLAQCLVGRRAAALH